MLVSFASDDETHLRAIISIFGRAIYRSVQRRYMKYDLECIYWTVQNSALLMTNHQERLGSPQNASGSNDLAESSL